MGKSIRRDDRSLAERRGPPFQADALQNRLSTTIQSLEGVEYGLLTAILARERRILRSPG